MEAEGEEKDSEKEECDERDKYLVEWEPNDTANPRNWSTGYKSWITFQLGMLALAASLGSSIISPAEEAIMRYTHVSSEVAVLPISFYILGFAFGPMLWAPVSEVGYMLDVKQMAQWIDNCLGLGPQMGHGACHVLLRSILYWDCYKQERCIDHDHPFLRWGLRICPREQCLGRTGRYVGS